MTSYLRQRVSRYLDAGACRLLSPVEVQDGVRKVRALHPGGRQPVGEWDIADMPAHEVRGLLSGLLPSSTSPAHTIWPSSRFGVEVVYEKFVSAYDCLWMPIAEDVIVVASDEERLIELHHEEVLRVYDTTGVAAEPTLVEA